MWFAIDRNPTEGIWPSNNWIQNESFFLHKIFSSFEVNVDDSPVNVYKNGADAEKFER